MNVSSIRRSSLGLALLLAFLALTPFAHAVSTDIVISQVYGGGGNSGATLRNDFIELFNRGTVSVSITGWSVQYASAAGSSWQTTALTGTLQPGQYYLVQQAVGAGGTVNLPTPDATGAIPMSATAGKVALVTNTTPLTCGASAGDCFPNADIRDFVGFGTTANNFEGAGPTPAPSNTTAVLRAANGCTDTDSNAGNFATGAPNPRNTASTFNVCPTSTDPFGTGAATPSSVEPGATTLLTVAVTPGSNPTSTGLAVKANLTAIDGAANQPFFDDGIQGGDVEAGDLVFSFEAVVSLTTSPGNKSLPATITDAETRSGAATILLSVPSDIVVSQVYGGGGNSGATLKNDFIELFNRGTSTIDITGWSVQYASAAGSSWQKTDLTGSIPAGHYYLVQQAAGAGGTDDLPTPDATGGIMMSGTAGKVALVGNATLLTGSGCPFEATVFDFVGYGGANCSEGSPTAILSNTTAALRGFNGCTDTQNNGADFGTGPPNPRNSSSPHQSCVPVALEIHEIQGAGSASPYRGELVSTSGVVTGRKTNGFFIQTPNVDADPNTSEGIFVFTSSVPPAAATVGNWVNVMGAVEEFVPSADLNSPPVTEISGSPTTTVISTGNPLPAPIALAAGDTNPAGSIEQLEKYEGMRVSVASLTVIGPTQGSVNEQNATSASNGVFYGVIAGIARPFRQPGIQVPDPLPPGSPCCVPRFDLNPERLRVDSDALGAAALEVTTGATVTGLVGPLDYGFRTYTIDPDPPPSAAPAVSGNISATPVPVRNADEFTVASFNIERFFDTDNDPDIGEPVLTAAAFENRLKKASLAIRNVLRTPDVLGVVEVENLATLQALAARINADSIADAQPNPNYVAYLEEGNDPGGIDVGFLVSDARVNVVSVTQEGKDATFIDPTDSSEDTLNDRPPLVLKANVAPMAGAEFPIVVIVNHLRSLIDIAQDPGAGPRVREKRRKQAEFLADLIQDLQSANANERIFSVGDYNAFQFNDGYVDLIGTIKGVPTPADQVVLASSDLVNPNLSDLVDGASSEQRYSYVFDGNAQVLDHILMSGNLMGRLRQFAHARLDADFPASFRNDPDRPERLSDHDAPVAFLTLDPDGDGVFDDGDACTASSTSATIIIDGCNTGAGNDLFSNGCKISDQIAACAAAAVTHEDFTGCVTQLSNQLRKDGFISNKEKSAIQQCAGRARIP